MQGPSDNTVTVVISAVVLVFLLYIVHSVKTCTVREATQKWEDAVESSLQREEDNRQKRALDLARQEAKAQAIRQGLVPCWSDQ